MRQVSPDCAPPPSIVLASILAAPIAKETCDCKLSSRWFGLSWSGPGGTKRPPVSPAFASPIYVLEAPSTQSRAVKCSRAVERHRITVSAASYQNSFASNRYSRSRSLIHERDIMSRTKNTNSHTSHLLSRLVPSLGHHVGRIW